MSSSEIEIKLSTSIRLMSNGMNVVEEKSKENILVY